MTDFQKVFQIPNIINIRSVGAELFHADRGMDRHDETNSCFSQFWEHAKKGKFPDGCKQNANENYIYKNTCKLSNNTIVTL